MSHARAPLEEEEPPRSVHRPSLKAEVRARLQWGLAQHILEASPVGLLHLDQDGRIAYANQAATDIMGYSLEELLGQPVRTHLQFSGSTPGLDEPMQILPLGEDLCWREDGSSFPIEWESAPLVDDGEINGTVLTFRDISRRRAIEHHKAEQISIVSHELRTPLTSIRSALGMLGGGIMDEQPDKRERLLDIAVSNADRLIRLVNDLLDLERLESDRPGLQYVICSMADLMHQAADGIRALADAHAVRIEVGALEVRVMGDPDRLLQVLTNLLANAIKFSPAGGATVWMEAESANGEVVVRVRDEGRGIPPQMLESIFDRFQQVDSSDARENRGTGLGLAICRSVVTQHNGQIWAESTIGSGTTMCVALPALKS
jgi:PAS domain S-box-containing protein